MHSMKFFILLFIAAISSGIHESWATGRGPALDARAIWQYSVDNHIQSVDELLPRLPDVLWNDPVFVYNSRSEMGASLAQPRVIASESNGFILTFNAGGTQAKGNVVEITQFDHISHEFQFYEISFPVSAHPPQKNPARCLTCHRQNPRPNWDAYPLWPGVYGSEESDPNVHPAELSAYKKFRSRAIEGHDPKTSRYKLLFHRVEVNDIYGANTRFGHLLDHLNSEKIWAELTTLFASVPRFARLKPAILGALVCMSRYDHPGKSIKRFLTPEFRAKLPRSYDSFEWDTDDKSRASFVDRVKRQTVLQGKLKSPRLAQTLTQPDFGLEISNSIWRLRYLLQLTHLNLKEWSLEFRSRHYAMNSGSENSDLATFILKDWVQSTDPDDQLLVRALRSKLPDPLALNTIFDAGACKVLQKRSLDLLSH